MGQAAADGAHVPHHGIADVPRDLRKEWALALEQRRGLDGVMRGQRADDERAALFLHARQRRHLADVDEVFGLREPELHGGQQTVAAGQELRLVLVLPEEVERFLDRGGLVILELCWIHGRLPYFFAAWRVFQTRSGVSGMASM